MTQRFVNNYSTTVAATFGAADTFLQVAGTAGLPTLAAGEYLLLTVFKKVGANESAHEVVKVTGIVANQLTVQRGIEGAAPAMFLTGDRVEARFTAAGADNLVQSAELTAHTTDTNNPHGVTAAQVGADPAGTAAAAIGAHVADANPHPQYTTAVEAAAAAPVQSVAGKTGTVALEAADVGLGSVDNTSDSSKTVLSAAKLTTARTIAGTSFDGQANIDISYTALTDKPALGTAAAKDVPATGNASNAQVVMGSDTRLTDARTPTAHTQAWSTITSTPTTISGYGITDATPSSHVGATGTAHGTATTSVAGFMSSTDKTKLDGVAGGATANATDAQLRDRSTHTGSQAISTVTGLQTALDAKQATLVSGTNIKTINGASVLGAGDIAIVGAKPSLQGDPAPYVTQTKTYQITNYNSFSTYSVTASAGTASIAGDTITFTAPVAAGNVSLTLTVDGQPTAFVITVQAAGVAKPTNTSPADGATGVTESPTLQSSAFVAFGLTDTHLASRWTVYQGGTQIHSSGWRTDALTSYTVPGGVMAVSTAYTWTVEHRGNALGDSPASTATSFTTAATFNSYIATPTATPANFGDALDGGFYAGMVWEQLTQSSTSMAIATGSKTFAVPSMTSAPIVYGGQTVEVRSRANPANKFVGTVTGALGTSLTINVTSVGGSGTFSDWSVMARHRIIVAPKASGEHAGIALKNANTALPTACQTLTEGFAATQAMRDADTSTVYPAAHWARNLNIGGRTDWYIPARDELELCWRNLKPTTTANYVTADRPTGASFAYANNGSYGDTAATHGTNNNSSPTGAAYTASVPGQAAATAFRTGGAEAYEFGSSYYWSSSDYDASNAWFQRWFSSVPGGQGNGGKTNAYRVRAVRRSVI